MSSCSFLKTEFDDALLVCYSTNFHSKGHAREISSLSVDFIYGFGFTPGTGLSPAREILFHAKNRVVS